MTTRPPRPRFWLHRSRRFWGGFALLLLIACLWVGSLCLDGSVTWRRYGSVWTGPFGVDRIQTSSLGLMGGGVNFQLSDSGDQTIPLTLSDWLWSGGESAHPLQWLPSFGDTSGQGCTPVQKTCFIPLWPFPFLCLILWPLWMARADKQEEETFRRAPTVPDPLR